MGKGEIRLGVAYSGTPSDPPPYSLPINGGGAVGVERGQQSLPCLTRESMFKLRGSIYWVPITTRHGGSIHVPQYHNGLCSDVMNRYKDTLGKNRAAIFNVDVRGNAFDSKAHAAQEQIIATGDKAGQYAHPNNTPWKTIDGVEWWNGAPWLGVGWTADPGLGREVWNQIGWDGLDWLGNHWTGNHWTGNHWTAGSWLGVHWTDSYWADNSWS